MLGSLAIGYQLRVIYCASGFYYQYFYWACLNNNIKRNYFVADLETSHININSTFFHMCICYSYSGILSCLLKLVFPLCTSARILTLKAIFCFWAFVPRFYILQNKVVYFCPAAVSKPIDIIVLNSLVRFKLYCSRFISCRSRQSYTLLWPLLFFVSIPYIQGFLRILQIIWGTYLSHNGTEGNNPRIFYRITLTVTREWFFYRSKSIYSSILKYQYKWINPIHIFKPQDQIYKQIKDVAFLLLPSSLFIWPLSIGLFRSCSLTVLRKVQRVPHFHSDCTSQLSMVLHLSWYLIEVSANSHPKFYYDSSMKDWSFPHSLHQ